MGGNNGDSLLYRSEQNAPRFIAGSQIVQRFEDQWMMAKQRFGSPVQRCLQRLLRGIETNQNFTDLGTGVANLESYIVPAFSQGRWIKGVEQPDQIVNANDALIHALGGG